MQYFLTGGTGFIGSHLAQQLIDHGHHVVALVRNPDTVRARSLPDEVELVRGDVTEKESLRDPMAGVDGVFHVAGWYRIGVDDPETAARVNVEGTRNVLELMADLEIPKGVYTSTLAVFSDTGGRIVDESYRYDGPHLTVYDRTKWQAHYEVAEPFIENGLPLVIVQPGAVYGPGDRGPTERLFEAYLRGEMPVIARETGYCWGHVEDTAAAHYRAMVDGEPGETYIVAGEPYTLVDVFDLAERITGIDAPRSVPPAAFRLLSRLVSPLERVVSLPPEYRAESLRVLGGVTYWGDNAKVTRGLNLEHRPFPDGLEETLRAEMERLEG
ncbi:NAD-dependent epimerase/dehydratase family protein [Natrialbaceae archaeon A-CW3]